ncbi:ATP-dependent zinc protease family protein [Mucisphaera calidilacus]|uniref:Retropepsin-like aspartic endopeptidase domain-containing protein n=1 Tax=Mucisphaera calidilacus TaxID=2527982 RepID=A0A518BZ32_9BACT|nr:RimK/LysX family protein [Mucisphaera calidilacus]QDU72228.1 hypothetical protein Pan265_20920 [Mucisphaera calidilacus]
MPEPTHQLITIGWREYVALPEWGITRLRAKIDTGARTSAIDVPEIEELPDDRIRFEVVLNHGPRRRARIVEADVVRTTKVKPSTGEKQERIVCQTPMILAGQTTSIEISLVCRRRMQSRMLVGRSALAEHFLVDAARTFLHPPASGVRP